MKAISIKQPWAGLIANGKKTIETRTWNTSYRGPLLICAGKTIDEPLAKYLKQMNGFDTAGPLGMAVAIVELAATGIMHQVHEAAALCEARPGLFAWRLDAVQRIQHFPVRGRLGLFDVDIIEGQLLPYK